MEINARGSRFRVIRRGNAARLYLFIHGVRVPETGRRGAVAVVLRSPGYSSLPNVTIEVR